MLAVSSYPAALINAFVSGGLFFIRLPDTWLPKKLQALRASYQWSPPFRAWTPVVVFFFLSNVFLVGVPLVPPSKGYQVYEHLPYWVSRLHLLLHGPVLTEPPPCAVARRRVLADLPVRRRVLVRVVRVGAATRRLYARARLGPGWRRVDAAGRAAGPTSVMPGARTGLGHLATCYVAPEGIQRRCCDGMIAVL